MTQATPAPRAAVTSTPRADGFRLPARFTAHQRTLLSWPCREDLFGPLDWTTPGVSGPRWLRHRPLRTGHGGRRPGAGGRGSRTARPGRRDRGRRGRRRGRHRPASHPARRAPGSATTAPSSCATTRVGSRWCTSASTAGASTSPPTTRTRGCRRPSPRPGACAATRRRSCSRAAPSTPTARAPCSPPSSACCTTVTSAAAAATTRRCSRSGSASRRSSGCPTASSRTPDPSRPPATWTTWRSSWPPASCWPRPASRTTRTTRACRRTSRCWRRRRTPPVAASKWSSRRCCRT